MPDGAVVSRLETTGCPKSMVHGPCGGVMADGTCEVRPTRCTFLEGPTYLAPATPDPVPDPAGRRVPRGAGGFERKLRAGQWVVVSEVNAPDSVDVTELRTVSAALARHVDLISVTDHSGANVHMSTVAAVAHLRAAGLEVMPTFSCRDRNRIGLQGDLVGAASLGAHAALIVTGNHVDVGDSPAAAPVFDLDSTRLLQLARRLRDTGAYDNGRRLERPPALLLGAAVHPFAPPLGSRPAQVLAKVRAGADFVISQHIFDLPRWREFHAGVQALRGDLDFHLLGGVAVLADETSGRRVNAGLRGFSIPEPVLRRLAQARDPQAEGIAIAAETVAELRAAPGVAGCLLAPVTGRTNLLGAAPEQVEIITAVLRAAGLDAAGSDPAGLPKRSPR